MEIDENEYLNLYISADEDPVENEGDLYSKKTLLYSSIFSNLFPHFYVSLHKRIRNIRNLSLQDDDLQYIALQEEDSQFGVFSDDDMLFESDVNDEPETKLNSKSDLTKIMVIVRNSSLLVDNIEYPFSTQVRSSCLVKGIRSESVNEEDSLLVSLRTGFLLLIRMFYVPQNFSDSDYDEKRPGRMVFKPFVVQWWDTSKKLLVPSLFTSGATLAAHSSGLAAVSTSSCGSFRLYNCNHTEYGVFFQKHESVTVNGSILHACFASPLKGSILDNHVMLLTMIFTNSGRLSLNLYGWTTSGSIYKDLTVSSLPLDGDFKLPIFIAPLSNDGGFLFVRRDEFLVVNVHHITSALYTFQKKDFDGPFPTNYYRPESSILRDPNTDHDEVLISTDSGYIYSVIIENEQILSIRLIIRISDPISVFSFEVSGEGYELIYGSSIGLNRRLYFEEILPESESHGVPSYSLSLLLDNYKNWAPVLDVQIVDAYASKNSTLNCKQELWCLSGIGKRSRLLQLRSGYSIVRSGDPFQSLRKVESMQWLDIQGSYFVVCTLPFETLLLELQINDQGEEEIIEVSDASLIQEEPTLKMAMISSDIAVQVTANSVLFTSLESNILCKTVDGVIVFCDIVDDIILTVSQTSSEYSKLELVRALDIDADAEEVTEDDVFEFLGSITLNGEVSMARILKINDQIQVVVGNFDSTIQVFSVEQKQLDKHFECQLLQYDQYNAEMKVERASFVPSDVLMAGKRLIFGTKDGHLLYFTASDTGLEFEDHFKLSEIDIKLHKTPVDDLLMVCCGSLWLIDFSKPYFPEPVLFEEKNDKPVKCILPIQSNSKIVNSFTTLFIRDEGLSFGKVSLSNNAIVRQVNVGESAKKFVYFPPFSVFIILSDTSNSSAKLRYVDRKTFKLLSHTEYSYKNKRLESNKSFFSDNEYPLCCKVWSLEKLGRVSKKLLVGCITNSGGSFKILDLVKNNDKMDNKPTMRVTQLNSFDHPGPISCIEQVDTHIIFSSERSLFSTSYNLEEKRLNPVTSLLSLTSDIISITVADDKIITITTKLDSVFQFTFELDAFKPEVLQLYSRDPSPKAAVNHTTVGSRVVIGDKIHSNVLILEKSKKLLIRELNFKISGVPRVYVGDFNAFWKKGSRDPCILSVSVDGEIVLFRKIITGSAEHESLKKIIPMKPNSRGEMEFSTETWDLAFVGKVGGKGFKAINKPYFRNRDNKKLIDYDINEISKVCHSYISL